jgi:amino acid adenylation domain-containing protein
MLNKPSCGDLTETDRHALQLGQGGDYEYPKGLRVHQLVSRQAEAAPQALALAACAGTMTYAELESRSNRLAHYLLASGVGPDVLVGLFVERSPMMAVGALAILKAGGAYIPLDTFYPLERIAFMLNDAAPRVVITQAHLQHRLVSRGPDILVLDPEPQNVAAQSSSAPAPFGNLDSLAYVIYTSGSTGQPKGVQIPHGGLLNLIFWHQRAFGITCADRSTQLTSPGFDAAVWELWPYLTAGASVHFAPESVRTQPEKLSTWLLEHQISISFVPTVMAERLLQLDWPADTTLRLLLTGADALRCYPPASLPFVFVNNYGPTECTVVATSGTVQNHNRSSRLPPIGRPIANTQVYILDDHLHPVPLGSPGELHIAGAGLARGYLNRPDLTREKFVSNPFSDVPESRLYKTGDLARLLPDSQIEFLGRVDDQVKILGHRVELNEVISVLSRHPSVQESTVVASQDRTGDKRLVAYIVARTSPAPTVAELRDFLRQELPDFMLPAVFVRLEALPMSANGKVDRSALPAPDFNNVICDEAFVEPGTPTEQRVAAIVAKLLGLESIGINDNFFLLGGNSLLGTQVIAQLRSNFDVDLTLLSLFDHPTVAGIAVAVEQSINDKLENMSEEEAQRLLDLSE